MTKTATFGKASMLAVCGLAFTACSDTHSPKSQGQTHWLERCDSDADCGELSCELGVCVATCEDGACDVSGVETECFVASSAALQALYGAGNPSTPATCLEPCSASCDEAFVCVGGACIPDKAVLHRNDGGAVPDGGSVSEGDAASFPNPRTGTMTLGLRNLSGRDIFVITGDCNGRARWFDMRSGMLDLDIQKQGCDCRVADPVDGCPTPPPVCQEDVIEMIPSGMEVSYIWDTGHWVQDGVCSNRVAVGEEDVLTFRACWLSERPAENTAGSLAYPEDFTCGENTFALQELFDTYYLEINP